MEQLARLLSNSPKPPTKERIQQLKVAMKEEPERSPLQLGQDLLEDKTSQECIRANTIINEVWTKAGDQALIADGLKGM
jgi:hypothetical protein